MKNNETNPEYFLPSQNVSNKYFSLPVSDKSRCTQVWKFSFNNLLS